MICKTFQGERLFGMPDGRRLRRIERAVWKAVQLFFRAESVIALMSWSMRSTSSIAGTGMDSFDFESTRSIVPMPQFGWQPHFNEPHSASSPPSRSFRSENGPDADRGYQSRIGSPIPACVFASWGRGGGGGRCF